MLKPIFHVVMKGGTTTCLDRDERDRFLSRIPPNSYLVLDSFVSLDTYNEIRKFVYAKVESNSRVGS